MPKEALPPRSKRERHCGGCTACVDFFPNVEGDGDDVQRSKKYRCLWLQDQGGEWLGDELRPDRARVIPDEGSTTQGETVVGLFEMEVGAVDREPWPSKLHRMDRHVHLVRIRPNGKRERIRARTTKIAHSGAINHYKHRTREES